MHALVLPVLVSSLAAAGSPPDVEVLRAAWQSRASAFAAHGHIAVQLDDDDFADLARGAVAQRRDKLDGADRAVGAVWTDLPREALWVSILDDTCFTLADGLTERHLPSSDPLQKLLFQHVDVPWPFHDRQWILAIRSNDALYAATGGDAWERTWTLAADQAGLAARVPGADMPTPDAVWTPLNDGGWLLVEAGGGNIVVYNARVDIGGVVPDDVFTAWTLASLRGLMTTVVDRARAVDAHYDAAHAPILRPDARPVPPWPATSTGAATGGRGAAGP